MIDNKENEGKYPVDLLKKWKDDHERKIIEIISGKNLLSKHPLALNRVINSIGRIMEEVLDLPETENAPNPDIKILFNNVVRYESVIREFAPYQGKLNKIYEEIEKEGSTKKELVLYNIKSIYIKIKRNYSDFDDIKKNADNIFDKVIEVVWEKIDNAPNRVEGFDQETIDFSLMIVIVDAFMRCNILEEPPKIAQNDY